MTTKSLLACRGRIGRPTRAPVLSDAALIGSRHSRHALVRPCAVVRTVAIHWARVRSPANRLLAHTTPMPRPSYVRGVVDLTRWCLSRQHDCLAPPCTVHQDGARKCVPLRATWACWDRGRHKDGLGGQWRRVHFAIAPRCRRVRSSERAHNIASVRSLGSDGNHTALPQRGRALEPAAAGRRLR